MFAQKNTLNFNLPNFSFEKKEGTKLALKVCEKLTDRFQGSWIRENILMETYM